MRQHFILKSIAFLKEEFRYHYYALVSDLFDVYNPFPAWTTIIPLHPDTSWQLGVRPRRGALSFSVFMAANSTALTFLDSSELFKALCWVFTNKGYLTLDEAECISDLQTAFSKIGVIAYLDRPFL